MNTELAQLLGMIRYEFRLQWRQRGLKVMFMAMLLVETAFVLVSGGHEQAVRLMYVQGTWVSVAVMLVILLPIVAADVIPRDRQLGVRELLASLPLRPPIYLIGKLLSTWISIGIGTTAVLAIVGVLARIAIGPFDVLAYAAMATIGVWLLIVMNCGLTILIASSQPTTMRAMLIAFVCVLVLPLLFVQVSSSLTDLINPLRLQMYFQELRSPQNRAVILLGYTLTSQSAIVLTVVFGLLELALAWSPALRWLYSDGSQSK